MVSFNPVPAFPEYTGPYHVGTADIEIPLNELAPSIPSPDPKVTTISARIFYPCRQPSRKTSKAYWYPNPQQEYCSAYLRFLGASSRLSSFISLLPRTLYYIALPCFQNAELLSPSNSQGRWPTMIFSHGLGGTRNMYSHICGSLASHGVVVIAPEHRDGSAPVSFIRDEEGKIVHTVDYQTIPHENTSSTQLARNSQLRQRLWELGETYSLAVKLDKGVVFSNHATTKKERGSQAELNLCMFQNSLEVHKPASVHFAGHSFGAVTSLQFLKSVFYDPSIAPASFRPLYSPARDSPIVRQITANTSLSLLDCWMLPTLDPTTSWLRDKPLPAYSEGGPGGNVILSVLSEGFYKWNSNWVEQRRALSPDPTVDPVEWTVDRLGAFVNPYIFYPADSAHLSQSDFGVLFPWLAKKAFKAQEPDRTVLLNTRAILEVWRNNGAELADTSDQDMELKIVKDMVDQKSKPDINRKTSDETLTDETVKQVQDKTILLRDGSVRGWIALGLGPEPDGSETRGEGRAAKDAGRVLKERAQNGNSENVAARS